ncbi:MAG: 4Fe-4S ferredoxin [Denitrovibrio sp.]|nr:MAG: 4Fe-4S ferredoxin [Denitrovibrio sp.]
MPSDVFFSTIDSKKHKSPLLKIKKLINRCAPEKMFKKGDLVAIKTHFGEFGNTAFLRPIFLRPVIEKLNHIGTKPYLTDTNTLYVGMRTNSVDHIHNATMNGFNFSTLQVPVIIADGMRGDNSVEVDIDGELLSSVKLASDIVTADGMVVVSHFKGHEVTGFGGAIKNLSMGCSCRQGKLDMHSDSQPNVVADLCTSCGRCLSYCASNAIDMTPTAFISDKCTGCAMCISVCPQGAIHINWDASSTSTQTKMAEYAAGVVKALDGNLIYLSIILSVSPACDCYPGNDRPVVGDIGFAASTDPVALDRACMDMVTKAHGGTDPFQERYPQVESSIQLSHAEKMGLGTHDYKLITVE